MIAILRYVLAMLITAMGDRLQQQPNGGSFDISFLCSYLPLSFSFLFKGYLYRQFNAAHFQSVYLYILYLIHL